MESVMSRFLRYVRINTQSDENCSDCPSSQGQWEFARLLADEMKAIGLQEVTLDERCYIMATLPANIDTPYPVIGFIAHMDTSPDLSGENVSPKIVENYDGKPIKLDSNATYVLDPREFPELLSYKEQTLMTTDGTTLLGADDKAGIAEILTAMEYLLNNPKIPHGKIRIGFTPDEEIGRGADFFDVEKFGADWAYTVDGGPLGELEYENFNAATATFFISGRNVHPGSAKNKMINAMHIGMEIDRLVPSQQRPEHTEDYEGFYHLIAIIGTVEEAKLTYIIRDHNRDIFEQRKAHLYEIAAFLNTKYSSNRIIVSMKDQYYNMKEKIKPVMHIIELADKAMAEAGVEPHITPIRGGTDGARLSYMNLPCPNLFTGGHNFHGRYEFIPVKSMETAVQVIVNIAKLAVKDS